jgi:hypothetical protein
MPVPRRPVQADVRVPTQEEPAWRGVPPAAPKGSRLPFPFPRRGFLQPGVPDGTWRYVGVTTLKGAVATVATVAIWPYLPDAGMIVDDPDRFMRKWAFTCWLVFSMFPLGAVWCAIKSLQGAWMALH